MISLLFFTAARSFTQRRALNTAKRIQLVPIAFVHSIVHLSRPMTQLQQRLHVRVNVLSAD